MKKLKLILILLLFSFSSFGQTYKWRASDYSSRLNNSQGWGSWSEWATSGVLIVAQNERVNIYSSTPQTYDMIETVIKQYDKDNNPIYSVMCVDENGTRCKMIWYHTANDGSYVIFGFSNLELMYKVVSLD
jgi:hypothetical protein